MLEKNIDDYWNVDGDRDMSDTWTGSTRFTVLDEKPPDGFSWSGGRLTRKHTTSRPDTLWPEIWKDMSDAWKRKEKQKLAIDKPKFDNARKLRGIYFLMMENARRKLEVPMLAAIPCKLQREKYRETCRVDEGKTKYACIVEADESTRKRMEGSPRQDHGDHIAGQGMNSVGHCNLVREFVSIPQAMKIPDATAAVEKECEKLEEIPAWQLTTVRNKNDVIAEARNKGRTVGLASLMDLCHLKNLELEPQIQRSSRTPRWQDDSGSHAVFTKQVRQYHKWRPQKLWM